MATDAVSPPKVWLKMPPPPIAPAELPLTLLWEMLIVAAPKLTMPPPTKSAALSLTVLAMRASVAVGPPKLAL